MKILLLILFAGIITFGNAQTTKTSKKKYSKDVQKITGTEEGVFRGFSFGSSKTDIKAKEKITLQHETDSVLTYTIQLDADDSADILYYTDSTGKVTSFATVFILQDADKEKNLKTDFIKYFNDKFGPFRVVREEDELWTSKEGYLVELKDTSDEAGMEIEIVYYKQ